MDLLVKTENPAALDRTLQQLGALVMMDDRGGYEMDSESQAYVVRSFASSLSFIKFAITNQRYGEIVGETDKYIVKLG